MFCSYFFYKLKIKYDSLNICIIYILSKIDFRMKRYYNYFIFNKFSKWENGKFI